MAEQTRRWILGLLASLGFISPAVAQYAKGQRGGRPACVDCHFWVDPETKLLLHKSVVKSAKLKHTTPALEPYGTCHVRSVPKWPVRFEYEWCGEHKPHKDK